MGFDMLLAAHPWHPIRGCPGRYSLPVSALPFTALAGAEPRVFRVAAAPDEVLVARLEDGSGVISYRRGDGTLVHTLGTTEGFARKLAQLGIELPP
jgi:hypothetical protein